MDLLVSNVNVQVDLYMYSTMHVLLVVLVSVLIRFDILYYYNQAE